MLGKIEAPLKDELKKIEWGDYIMSDGTLREVQTAL